MSFTTCEESESVSESESESELESESEKKFFGSESEKYFFGSTTLHIRRSFENLPKKVMGGKSANYAVLYTAFEI
jgi:hypothetical protein